MLLPGRPTASTASTGRMLMTGKCHLWRLRLSYMWLAGTPISRTSHVPNLFCPLKPLETNLSRSDHRGRRVYARTEGYTHTHTRRLDYTHRIACNNNIICNRILRLIITPEHAPSKVENSPVSPWENSRDNYQRFIAVRFRHSVRELDMVVEIWSHGCISPSA